MQASASLKYLFSSTLRIRVLSHFFFHPGETFYVRKLATEVGESAGNVARELRGLENAGILAVRVVGNQKHYSLREDSPILEDLRNIFLKTAGASAELRSALKKLAGVELAFIYGSYASGEAHAASDLDLMVIGEVSDKALAPTVARIERRLKRPINYTLYPRLEAEKRRRRKGDFVQEVLSGPRMILVGDANDRLLRAS